MKRHNIRIYLVASFIFLIGIQFASAQSSEVLTLQQAIDMALENNHLLNIKKLQVDEKASKVTEGKIKAFPTVTINSTWQYNQNLAKLTIPKGSMGTLPLSAQMIIPLPSQDLAFDLSKHETFNAGVMLYQPISQLGKIKAGIDVSKTDVSIARQEEINASLQIQQAVEKLYYGLLINKKQKEEADAKLELAKMKLHDVESALASGKTVDVNRAGLMANIADEEQNLLKLEIQAEDYTVDFKNLTGFTSETVTLVEAETLLPESLIVSDQKETSETNNPNLIIAGLNQQKAKQGVDAARWSYLPDLGLVAGYTYQQGSILYPEHNPFVGANLKWNIQDIFSNRQLVNQRNFLLEQAAENLENTRQQVTSDIEKANRKIRQAIALINVAQKAVTYREEELKIQQNKETNGLNTAADLLNTKSLLAKAHADLLAAQLNYRMALSDLKMLTGK
jgi:outer membrane protein